MTVSAQHLENYNFQPQFAAKYSIGEELGNGGFGFVVSAIQKTTSREVAVKFIFRDKVPTHAWASDKELGMTPMEIYVLKNVRHPSIIAFLDAFQDSKFFYLVMELHGTQWSATNPLLVSPEARLSKLAAATEQQQLRSGMVIAGPPTPPEEPIFPPVEDGSPRPNLLVRRTSCDLFECIEHHSKFSEKLAKKIFRQIIECVNYLNDIGVCHRDIKDENIVIDNNYVVKLVDFGSAVILPRSNAIKPHYFDKFYGTISFASPEILLCKPYCAEPAEIWSLGILLYTVLTGEVPFNDPNQAISGPYASPRVHCTASCLHLIQRMLEKNPEKRATIAEVMDHPWFKETE
ncbi:kinase-like domain-containing protein [Umbelopsis sp. PMI_123]|nr:kinase-like domain-containing protein [Umbelopsis sp. PMI_123]